MSREPSEVKLSHTPGPWIAEPATGYVPDRPDDSRWIVRGEHRIVKGPLICIVTEQYREEHIRNAKIIAAAPDLLAACKAILSAHAVGEIFYRSSGGCGYEAMLAVESAIAKAETGKLVTGSMTNRI